MIPIICGCILYVLMSRVVLVWNRCGVGVVVAPRQVLQDKFCTRTSVYEAGRGKI